MEAFAYANPKTVKEAVSYLGTQWGEAEVLPGGTDVINLLKEYVYAPKTVVSLREVAELKGIAAKGNTVRIGPMTTIDEILESADLRKSFPSLVHVAQNWTSPQLRHMSTVYSELTHRPYCWYFRNGFGILGLDSAGKSLIPSGENKYHAIFPSGNAYFVSPSSLGPALVSLNAKLRLTSPTGSREVEAAKFFVAPANGQTREFALLPNEVIADITLPVAASVKNATYEVRHREAIADWPLVTASVALTMSGNTIQSARVVLGHVAPTPYVASAAQALLKGKTVSLEAAEAAGNAAAEGAKPLSQNAYKVQLVKTAVKRAIAEAAGLKA